MILGMKTRCIAGISLCFFLSHACPAREVRETDETTILHRIGLIGCFKQKQEAPSLQRYIEWNPELILWLGDNIYCDTLDMKLMEEKYQILSNRKEFKAMAHIPQMATWDDHDMGWNNAGVEYPKREESKKLFMDFWKFPADPAVRRQPGVFNSQCFGPADKRVQVIMLDGRYEKSSERVLSEEQWTWLDKQLDAPAKIRFIVSGHQILVSKNTIFEAWSQSGKEQQRLFDLIKRKNANGIIFLSGDQHFVEISTIEKALGYDAIEFTFAGINQDEKESLNDHREGKVVHETHKAAYLQIHWDQSPRISFIATDAAGKTLISRMVEVSDLQHHSP